MENEKREELLKVIKDGSQRKLRKVKKEDLLDLIDDLLTNENSDKSRLLEEIQDLREQILLKDEVIKEHKESDNLIEEYRDLVQELKDKYGKALDQNLVVERALNEMTGKAKLLRQVLVGTCGVSLILIIIFILL
jgi:molybdopterin converting factor small subunit